MIGLRNGVAHAPGRASRGIILGVIGAIFLIPFVAMIE